MRLLRAVLVVCIAGCGVSTPEDEALFATRHDALGVPALIRDIEPSTTSLNSSPFAFAALDAGRTVFFATGFGVGTELYVTDGTAAGTSLVADLVPGTSGVGQSNTFFTELNGSLYFRGNGGSVIGAELYRTNGTAAGSGLVIDACAGCSGIQNDSNGINPLGPYRVGSSIAFIGNGAASFNARLNIWESTDAGFRSIALRANPQQAAATDSRLFFVMPPLNFGLPTELWMFDGNDAGPIAQDAGADLHSAFAAVGSVLYFQASVGSNSNRIFRADSSGTAVQIADLGSLSATSIQQVGGVLYAVTNGNSLHRINLTTLVRDQLTAVNTPPAVIVLGPDRALFNRFSVGVSSVDSSDAGPTLLIPNFQTNLSLAAVNGTGWASSVSTLMRTDGTTGGTSVAVTLDGGSISSIGGPCPNGGVCLAASLPGIGVEPWAFQGGTATLLGDLNPTVGNSSQPFNGFVTLGDRVLFTATTTAQGQELWRTDGVTAELVQDLRPGTASSNPANLVAAQGKAYFVATNTSGSSQFFRTDGTDAGLEALTIPQGSSFTLRELTGTPLGAFATITAGTGHSIIAWLGPDAGVTTVAVFPNPMAPARTPGLFTAIGNTVYFYGWTPSNTGQVWRTDGTPGNTIAVTSLTASAGNQLFNFANFQNRLYFSNNGGQLQRLECNGSVSLVGSNQGFSFTPSGDSLFMAGTTNGIDNSLYRVQGTTGTQVIDLNPSGSDGVRELQSWGLDRVVFSASDGVSRNVYSSDGTAAGTRRLTTLPLLPGLDTGVLAVPGGSVYVPASFGDAGFELVELDGLGGATLVGDLVPGLAGSDPRPVAAPVGRLVFHANTVAFGREPWGVDIVRSAPPTPSWQAACSWPIVDAGIGVLDGGSPADAGTNDAGVDAGSVDAGGSDAGADAGVADAGGVDAGGVDAGDVDAGDVDAGDVDAGEVDAGDVDAGEVDAGEVDAGEVDAGEVDAGELDAGEVDAGPTDAGGTSSDAGSVADAGASATDAGMDGGVSGGCGCSTVDPLLALALSLGLLRRRARSSLKNPRS
ncbi:MAG: hypothetical protein QM817_41090 [Archangium sp.]